MFALILLVAFFNSGCGDFFVSGSALNSISLSPSSIFLTIGDTKQFTANGTTVNGDSVDVSSTAKWTSTSNSVATVDAGLVKAIASGTATITVSQDGVEDTSGVIVDASALDSINITSTSTIVSSGSTLPLTATATFDDGSQRNVTSQVSWTSSSTSTATVSSSGVVTGVVAGTVTITATVTTASSTVTSNISLTVQ